MTDDKLVTIVWDRSSYDGDDLPTVVKLTDLDRNSQQALMNAVFKIKMNPKPGTDSKSGSNFSGAFSADPHAKQNGPIPMQDAPPGPAAPTESSGGKAY